MICDHLKPLETALIASGHKETYRGTPWSRNCREWVYFDVLLDTDALKNRFKFAPCVKVHSHRGTHDGTEHGFTCDEHHDAVMGVHPSRFEATEGTDKSMIGYLKKQKEEKTFR